MRARISWRYPLFFVGLMASGFWNPYDPAASAWHNRDLNAPLSPAPRSLTADVAASLRQRVNRGYTVPLGFEPNHGQTDSQVKFLSRGRGFTLLLTATEAVLSVRQNSDRQSARSGVRNHPSATTAGQQQSPQSDRRPLILRMQPVGANPAARVTGESRLPGEVNYVRGRDVEASVTGIPTYGRVRYESVYPGVDLVYYGNDQQLEYDFVVAPGADPARIRLAFTGAEKLTVNAAGELVLHTAAGELRQPKPVLYQEIDGVRREISGSYVLAAADQVGFRVGAYDRSRPLVIDPVLAYSTYFGGSSDEIGWDIAVDAGGNVYITGARPSVRFQDSHDLDAFVAKFSPAGALLWATDVGDTCDDEGRGMAVDRAGSVYITGQLGYCYPFPELPGGPFVAKLSARGASSYMFPFGDPWSGADLGQAVAVDTAGNAYITGIALSSGFPTTPGAFQGQFAGGIGDGFVVKVNPSGTALLYASYLGGTGYESFNDIAVDSSGHAYVTGSTNSWDFPTRSAYQPQHPGWGPGDLSGFVAKLTADGSNLVYSTYLGGGPTDIAMGIALDSSGNAYVTGLTESDRFPTTPGVVQPQPGDDRLCYYRLCTDAFVTKIGPSGTSLVYSTYLGGNIFDEGTGIAVDAAGNAYVTGSTSSMTFPTAQAFQPQLAGETDGFVAKLNGNGSALVYSSYLGGSKTSEDDFDGIDGGIRIAVDGPGTNAYVVGVTHSSNFPVTAAHQPTSGGGVCGYLNYRCSDAFVTKIGGSCVGLLCQPSGGGGGVPIRLDVSVGGGGTGAVASVPAGIACPGDCDGIYGPGTQVTLTASPGGGSRFDGWTGCDAVADAVCTVTMNDARFVTARFGALPPPPLPAPLTTTLNQASFTRGQTLVLGATLTPAVATHVDAYIVIDVPGIGPLSLQLGGSVVPGIVPITSGFVPFPFAGPIFQYTFNGGEPAGAYQFRAFLTHAGTANVIGTVHVNPLVVIP